MIASDIRISVPFGAGRRKGQVNRRGCRVGIVVAETMPTELR